MAIGVGLGAFGAHGLKKFADDYAIAIWHTATLYLLIHAVGLIVVGAISQFDTTTIASRLTKTALLLQAGIVLFSGSLYAIALGAPKWLGAITPIGGISFIIAWLSLAIAIKR
ncbi:MAG: DUF423 domain-containing protein [Moraxella sp.]|nr:DUF423 domain-containing protein [Moraxella sp.]